jgi:CelD/BcsL family acetyltransferase involved in cellulose biosynthesis
MGYRVYYIFDDDTTEDLLDELFETEEEARAAALNGMGDYSVGVETLQMGGHDYPEAKIIDYDIEEESDLLD